MDKESLLQGNETTPLGLCCTHMQEQTERDKVFKTA
ncbi:hypothetical protein WwAna0698 [Wolbachia endosymbiont of Drosophila ananassae]|nr:hypothetical protein WwAna0698 [Wolbachia endosymbiont of Drosophila ananassae]